MNREKFTLIERVLPESIRKGLLLATAAFATLFLVACDDDDDPVVIITPQGDIRVIHASPDAPAVNVMLDDLTVITALDYAQSSGFLSVDAGDADITVEGIVPSGNVEVINVPNFTIAEDSYTTIIAVDPVASITPLVVENSASAPASNEVALRVVHASPAAPPVDIYVTAFGDDINAASPAFSFAYQETVDAGALMAGEVQIRATLATTKTVVYDSGAVDLAPFAGSQLMIVAVSTTNPTEVATAPIKLIVATDDALVTLRDTATQAGARVVHASPDAGNAAGGAVEVFASSAALGMASPLELIDAFSYLGIVPAADSHVGVPVGDYIFDVAPDTDSIGDSVFTSGTVPLAAGAEYTVVAGGRVLSAPAFGLLLSEDNSRAVATQASVKVIHAAPAAGNVDVYVTAAGDFSVADVENGLAGDPLLSDFAYGDITGYVAVAPADYDIRVTAGGVVAINVEGLILAAGSVSTVVARGPIEPAGMPNDFGVVLLTN